MNFTINLRVPGEITRAKGFAYSIIKHNTGAKFSNLLGVEWAYLRQDLVVRGYPYILKIDPSNRCNLKCPYCFTGAGIGSRPKGSMSLPVFKKIIDELGRYAYRVLLYGQGEPLMCQDLVPMVEYATSNNVGVSISSNLNLLDEDTAKGLVDAGLEYLVVSMDGTNQQSYERYRVGGRFQKAVDAIGLLVELKRRKGVRTPIIEWQYLVFKHNEDEMLDALKMARAIGVDVVRFAPFSFATSYTMDEVRKWVPNNVRYSYYDPQTGERRRITRKARTCAWLYRTANFNWDGSVSACCNFNVTTEPSCDLGNICEQSFSEIWNGEKFIEARLAARERLQGKPKSLDAHFCYKCDMV